METVILVCLLIIIALMLHDKIITDRSKAPKKTLEKFSANLPDIMGQPKLQKSLLLPNSANVSQKKDSEKKTDNFDVEIEKGDNIQMPQKGQEDVLKSIPDLEQEEEDWKRYGISDGDDGFAQGVTFEELSSVWMLLKNDKVEPYQKEAAVTTVRKMQGTELFALLENSMESTSRKIGELLDGRLSSEIEADTSTFRKNDLNDFDIGEFV
ncbi:conjugal transfer protein TraD [Flavobacterium sp. GSB-24]|uniref:conjugal transfer protein TraD n=1 Tax=Flavobacterium sp. GSB-24 TaxID=2994319 RepID=UPI0024924881|nr:conjugal transfer protein TraD [Flavobacterium sp. GSB-24]